MLSKEEIEKVENIAKSIGVENNDEKSIFKLFQNQDSKDKTLSLKQGKVDSEPWFIIDEKDNIHVMLPANSATMFVESYKRLAQENFDLRLERSILRQLPIDFADVFVVCMDEISKLAQKEKSINIDFDAVVRNVKDKYPNLFLDMELNIKDINKRENYE